MGAMRRWFDSRRRKIDMDILWPQCVQLAKTQDLARSAFYYHISNDPVWTRHYTEDELYRFVNTL